MSIDAQVSNVAHRPLICFVSLFTGGGSPFHNPFPNFFLNNTSKKKNKTPFLHPEQPL